MDIGEGLRSLLHCTTEDFVPQPLFLHLDSMAVLKDWGSFGDALPQMLSVGNLDCTLSGSISQEMRTFLRVPLYLSSGSPLTKCNLWEMAIFHSGNNSRPGKQKPAQQYFEQLCFDSCNFGSFKNFGVCDNVVLIQVEDDVREMLMESF